MNATQWEFVFCGVIALSCTFFIVWLVIYMEEHPLEDPTEDRTGGHRED
jgi:hypothetical protein